jgi:hypothetical protein
MIIGSGMDSRTVSASSIEEANTERGTCKPIESIAFLNRSLSSAFFMASIFAPMSSTPYFCNVPLS